MVVGNKLDQISNRKDIKNIIEDQFGKEAQRLTSDVEELKSQQDVLKISYTINEKKLLEKIKIILEAEIANAVKGKEKEILMHLWIDKLSEIITNFENLKNANPGELTLQIEEIANMIELFRQKLLT